MAIRHIHPPAATTIDFEALAVSTTAVGLTATEYQKSVSTGDSKDRVTANRAVITVEAQSLRYRLDGTAPTSTVGHLATAGDVIELNGIHQIVNFLAIRSSGTDSAIHVTYYEQ